MKTHKRGWELPGGQVEIGETPPEAAIRETQEEAGITIRVRQLGVVHSNLSRGILIFGFFGDYVSGEPTPSDETPEVGWFPRDAVLPIIGHPADHGRVVDLFNFAGQVAFRAYYLDPYQVVSQHLL